MNVRNRARGGIILNDVRVDSERVYFVHFRGLRWVAGQCRTECSAEPLCTTSALEALTREVWPFEVLLGTVFPDAFTGLLESS